MALKLLVPLTTLATDNEQTAVSPRTLTGAGTTFSREYPELGAYSRAIWMLDVTAQSGTTPTLDVKIQGWDVLSGKWRDVITFTQVTGAQVPITPAAQTGQLDYQLYRASFVVGGTATPTFTFTLGAICHSEEPIVVGR
jgi:hypothetical protein